MITVIDSLPEDFELDPLRPIEVVSHPHGNFFTTAWPMAGGTMRYYVGKFTSVKAAHRWLATGPEEGRIEYPC